VSFAEAMADLFGGLSLPGAHVLGHGVGGAVALKLAAHHPELVKRLALIAPLVYPPRLRWGQSILLAPVIGGLFFRQMLGRGWFYRIYRDRVHPQASQEELALYYESISSPATRAALLATLRACTDASSVIADSRRVRAHTLILWGLEDRLLPIELGRSLSREMPRAGLELMQSCHAPHEEFPAETARVLSDFFSGRRAGFTG
jgi:pimeloyl-ACP methyl ester carboxylesterase